LTEISDSIQADATIIGGGIAGLASSIHLVRAGFRVVCIEANASDATPVGESLDWSAPELLAQLGLPMQHLIDASFGTWKRHVILRLANGTSAEYVPGEWLARPPFNIELRTLHVDRSRLNAAICEIAIAEGVEILRERVAEIETYERGIRSITTTEGKRITSPWFLDASGSSARLFARKFNLEAIEYGPPKVAMWTYLSVADAIEGTTIHTEGNCPSYMEWVWEIPIHKNTVSIGAVLRGETIKALRSGGQTTSEIFRSQVARLPRFQSLSHSTQELSAAVTSYRCRVHRNFFGPNWLIVGEAAAMVDPMTSNGVTAALRHASEAAALIIRYRNRKRIPWLAGAMYCRRAQDLARFFNCGIEKVIYDAPIRNRIGMKAAGDVYTIPAWSLNNVYSRFRPRGVAASLLFCSVLGFFRAVASLLHAFCRLNPAPCEEATR
jgi:menaquinone-9 beta-reductase